MPELTKDSLRNYLKFVVALQRSMEVSIQADQTNAWKYSSCNHFARKYAQILRLIADNVKLPPIFDKYDIEAMRKPMGPVATSQKRVFENVLANLSLLRAFLEGELDIVEDQIAELFDFLRSRLRSAMFSKPDLEREVQDCIERLLIGHGLQKGQDYDRETGRVKTSGKESVPDFVFLRLNLSVEVKLIKTEDRVRKVIDEINADIRAYTKGYQRQLYMVYDLGFVRNDVEFRHDLENDGAVNVIIIKH